MKVTLKRDATLAGANCLWHFMEYDEEQAYYHEILERVIKNPRFYLDHLDELSVFRVSFLHYYPEEKQLRSSNKDFREGL